MIRSAIAFGIGVIGCLYVAYWALVIGIATIIIISTYLRENKHPAGKPALHESIRYDAQINSPNKFTGEPKRNPPK